MKTFGNYKMEELAFRLPNVTLKPNFPHLRKYYGRRPIKVKEMIKHRYNHIFLLIYNNFILVKKHHKHKPIPISEINSAENVVDITKSTIIRRVFSAIPGESDIDQNGINELIFKTYDTKAYKKYCRMTNRTIDSKFIKDMNDAKILNEIN